MADLTAQKRTTNNSVHLYRDGEALCANRFGHPSMNDSEPTFEVTPDELQSNDYLKRDGEIVGKFCDNCLRVAVKTVVVDE